MFPAQQDQAKTAEEGGFPGSPRPPGRDGEIRGPEQTRTTLVQNEQWLAHNADKLLAASEYEIVPASEYDQHRRGVPVKEDEYVLRCLGAAVMMRWSTLPGTLQRELFDHASSPGEFDQDSTIDPAEKTARLKGLIARFLHNHNGPPNE
jgi:hypothetical protein